MLFCKSARYVQHNSYKLGTEHQLLNTNRWVITQKNTILNYFQWKSEITQFLRYLVETLEVSEEILIVRFFDINDWQTAVPVSTLFVLHI